MMTESVTLNIDEAMHLAFLMHRNRLLVEAEMLYRRILEKVPENLNTLNFFGLLCHQQSRYDEAAELIERITKLDPQNADAFNNLGNVREGLGDAAAAEDCYRQALSLHPEHAPAHNNLGVILMARGDLSNALASYRRAVELKPQAGDFLCNLGNALRRSGDIDGAITTYQKAIAAKPDYVTAFQGLARSYMEMGRQQEAVAVFDEWLKEDPDDPVISYLRSACLGSGAPDRAPDEFVLQVFDEMADTFDSHLAKLDYHAPALVDAALAGVMPSPSGTLDILDAGCGTGLCGSFLKPYARRLTGVDLSARMLGRAHSRRNYDELVQAELTDFTSQKREAFDLIASADTLCYFGDLVPFFQSAAGALRPGGFLTFTLEDDGGGETAFKLNQHGRYAHGRPYVENSLHEAGLAPQSISSVVLRKECGNPVAGHLVVAMKKEAA